MPTPPPRKSFPFQIHLSTAIVMMFVAGLFVWGNVDRFGFNEHVGKSGAHLRETQFGWPVSFTHLRIEMNGSVLPQPWEVFWIPLILTLLTNGVITFGSLFAIWFLCERLLRRRGAPQ